MATAAEIGARVLATLGAQAERNRQAGLALAVEVRAAVRAHPGEHLTARQVRALLGRERPVSLRRIQEILRAQRAESSASRL